MAVRTVGVEEELLLVDPETRTVSARAPQVLKELHDRGRAREAPDGALDHELFRHQLETRTEPATDLADIGEQLVAARKVAGEAAGADELALVACGVVPLGDDEPRVTRDDRYQDMLETYGEIARSGGTCGMHVHVAIDSDEEGVAVIDAIAPWLPVLVAVTANSPYYRGRDTGHASWRAQVWDRWPSAGPTEPFGTLATYRWQAERLVALGGARDEGMLYLDARLAVAHPTVEVRVCDVCTEVEDAVLVAALVRGLVTSAATGDLPSYDGGWRVAELRAARWRASRYGVSEGLVHPLAGEVRPAREVLEALTDAVRPVLDEAGDTDRVLEGVDRVLLGGGALRQRSAYERTGGLEGVVDDLVARTAQTWER